MAPTAAQAPLICATAPQLPQSRGNSEQWPPLLLVYMSSFSAIPPVCHWVLFPRPCQHTSDTSYTLRPRPPPAAALPSLWSAHYVQVVRGKRCHFLLFPDLSMQPSNYVLANFRMAPVQARPPRPHPAALLCTLCASFVYHRVPATAAPSPGSVSSVPRRSQ